MNPLAFMGASPGAGEILLILLVVLMLFGAKKVPELARSIGRALSEFRRAAREMQDELLRADQEPPGALPADDPSRHRDDLPAAAEQAPESSPEDPHENA